MPLSRVPIDATLAAEPFCYLTTTGRKSGRAREIEIWFAVEGETLYMLAGGGEGAHWVRNLQQTPAVRIRVQGRELRGEARLPTPGSEEDSGARRLLVAKYQPGYSGNLSDWGRTALAVAVDLAAEA